jgi:tRNA(Ile)-lysidine synthase
VQITLSPGFLDRFSLALGNLGVGDDNRIMLAVSGGPDSLAMLLLAREIAAGRIVAATVDHKLRPEAATAHHGDDQLETILMRLARGSGLDGLAAIRARNGRVIRPLLGFSKSELEKICADAGIEPVRDPSNDNADFDRVAMRQWLAQSTHPFVIDRANRVARSLGDAAEALTWVADGLSERRVMQENTQIQCDASHLPRDLKRRLLLLCVSRLEPDLKPRGDAIDRLLADLETGKTATIGNILCRGGAVWQFSVAPPRRADR